MKASLRGLSSWARAFALAAALGPCLAAPALAEEWPSKPLTLIAPTPPGGSLDRLARILAQPLGEELGQPVIVENKPGGGTVLAHKLMLAAPADGYTAVMSFPTPFLATSILTDRAGGLKLEDLAFVNNQWGDYSMLVVPKSKPYQTFAELLAAIKAAPGTLVGIEVTGAVGDLVLAQVLQKLGVARSDTRWVTYNSGGGPIRAALLGGQVDFSIVAAEGTIPIKDDVRVLAVFRDERSPDWDAPTLAEVLKEYEISVPVVEEFVRSVAFPAAFREEHPDRWKIFVEAMKRVLERDDMKAALVQAEIAGTWIGPERTQEQILMVRDFIAANLKAVGGQ